MVVNVVEDVTHGNKAYCIPFEGCNGLGAWAMWSPEIERNLLEIEDFFAPIKERRHQRPQHFGEGDADGR